MTEKKLREEDKVFLRAFAYKLRHKLTNEAFADIPNGFPIEDMPTLATICSRIAFLSGIKADRYDCCPDSCMAYTGYLAELDKCSYCETTRYDEYGNPRQQFSYLPLKLRLLAHRQHTETALKMFYRRDHEPDPSGTIRDIFDGEHYQNLRTRKIVVDGQNTRHKFFDDERDIALGLSTDGFAPWRRRKKSAWPIIAYNLNLPPEIRFHKEFILPLGVVPGPSKPKNFDSFLWPAVQELLEFTVGVPAYDVISSSMFIQHAHVILVSGDIPAVSMVMQMKGHNAIVPCRMCMIRGLRPPGGRGTVHYVPLDRSRHPSVWHGHGTDPPRYDPGNLPLRTHDDFLTQGREVIEAETDTDADELAKLYGVKGVPLLSYLPSLSFPHSFPYDFMHLIWENLMPNRVRLWTSKFKGLDEGNHSYQFTPTVWQAIGEATARTGDTLPAIFGPRLGNIADSHGNAGTADAWSVWTLYIAPVLLRRRFRHIRYYKHFVDLVELLQLCLQFELSQDHIAHV